MNLRDTKRQRVTIRYEERLRGNARSAVYALLTSCDYDFVPPLSQRTSTHQGNLAPQSGAHSNDGVQAYFDEMSRQPFFLAWDGDALVGFLAYIPNYECPPYITLPSNYVTTVCVERDVRGQGIGSALYEALESRLAGQPITIRTWSTNASQNSLLVGRGYRALAVLPNDRGPGVDTVYYGK